jgi:hypothetical protein
MRARRIDFAIEPGPQRVDLRLEPGNRRVDLCV